MTPHEDGFDALFGDSTLNPQDDWSRESLYPDIMDFEDHYEFFADYEIPDENTTDAKTTNDKNVAINETEALNPEYQFRTYNLRPSARDDGKAVWITWLDTDDSGTYDPNKSDFQQHKRGKNRKPSSSRSHQQPKATLHEEAKYDNEDEEEEEPEPLAAYLSRLAARQKGVSITVTLDLTTIALQNLATKIPDNWPGENFNILSDEHYRFLASQLNNSSKPWRPYNLRGRNSGPSEDLKEEDWSLLPEGRIPDPAGIEVDLRNHPAARGCKACRELRLECTLLDDAYGWPCRDCIQGDCECEFITLPRRKTTCEHCRRRRLPCSYSTDGSNPAEPCTSCTSLNTQCIAGPAVGSIRERISYDHDHSVPKVPVLEDRKFVTCTACRQNKISCSLRYKTDPPPCASCEENEIECTFERLPQKPKQSCSSTKEKPSRQNWGYKFRDDKDVPATAEEIHTALCHPIQFLHDKPSECTWCTAGIGVLGRGAKKVLVVPSEDRLSYTEISGGHNTDGKNPEKMCSTCTLERCRIIGCIGHEFRPLDNLDIKTFDPEPMFERIINGCPSPNDVWCALCPSPALCQCCTPQKTNLWGEPIEDPYSDDARGCGLKLCEACAVCLGEQEEFDILDPVIDAIQDEENAEAIWPLGGRADIELLRKDGLLVKNMLSSDPMDMDE